MNEKRRILIVGGGTAGWLTAAYLAKAFGLANQQKLEIVLLESPQIGIIGVGEGSFPTIRTTLHYLGIDEAAFVRGTSATFKQGIRFVDWLHAPDGDRRHLFFHPFEAPFEKDGVSLVPYWLLQDPASRPPFAEAITIQNRVADAKRGPKRRDEGDFTGPLNYAYHFDAVALARVLAERARSLGVTHLQGTLQDVIFDDRGAIDHILTDDHGALAADMFIDCSGFRAELIGRMDTQPLVSVRDILFTDRAIACKVPYDRPDAPIESFTIATAHEAGWTWDIGLEGARGVGCVYSSDHLDDDRAAAILYDYLGVEPGTVATRRIAFETGYRRQQWVKNCVAVGLSAGFLEPLESTGVVLIEAAIGMIADLFPHSGPAEAPARRFNELMTARYENIVIFLKLHYCLSRRPEPFWRANADPATIPERLRDLLKQWRHRPPGRFDFILDLESFAYFNYQYILYGMEFDTDLAGGRSDFPDVEAAARTFARIRSFGERATQELPPHRELIRQINDAG
ncbi:tryptophan halogenase family protein [Sphingomonas sp.]|uniref:tryptophan halogenase family protein n=1 Tax=Sphingomonas sp. TaxID=28214 RepID=UPI003D6D11E3